MVKKATISVTLLLAASSTAVLGQGQAFNHPVPSRNQGQVVPPLKLTSLDGATQTSLTDLNGKCVIVDFWASWCGKCHPAVSKLQLMASDPRWRGRVEFLTASVDRAPERALAMIRRKGWMNTKNFSVDLQDLGKSGIRQVPTLMVISPDGSLAKLGSPYRIDLERELKRLLAV